MDPKKWKGQQEWHKACMATRMPPHKLQDSNKNSFHFLSYFV